MFVTLIIESFYFMLPAYIANMAPVLVQHQLKMLAVPVDLGCTFRKRPIFGSHKTYRGIIFATLFGMLVFFLQKFLMAYPFFASISIVDYTTISLWLGFLLGFGAIMGDLIKSFFKRQKDHPPGVPWIPFDQLDYVAGALLFSALVYVPSWQHILAIILVSFLLHIVANHLGYYLGIHDVKW